MSHILCPSCAELVPAQALRCSGCGELLRDFRECPDCRERVRAGARVCRHCGFRFVRSTPPPIPSIPSPTGPMPESGARAGAVPAPGAAPRPRLDGDFTVGATPLGGLLAERSFSALIAPPDMRLAGEVVTVRRWSALGLSSEAEHLPVERIGGVRLVRSLFWSGIRLDPAGFGPPLELTGLRRDEAQAMISLLERAVAAFRPEASSLPSASTPSSGPAVSAD